MFAKALRGREFPFQPSKNRGTVYLELRIKSQNPRAVRQQHYLRHHHTLYDPQQSGQVLRPIALLCSVTKSYTPL